MLITKRKPSPHTRKRPATIETDPLRGLVLSINSDGYVSACTVLNDMRRPGGTVAIEFSRAELLAFVWSCTHAMTPESLKFIADLKAYERGFPAEPSKPPLLAWSDLPPAANLVTGYVRHSAVASAGDGSQYHLVGDHEGWWVQQGGSAISSRPYPTRPNAEKAAQAHYEENLRRRAIGEDPL